MDIEVGWFATGTGFLHQSHDLDKYSNSTSAHKHSAWYRIGGFKSCWYSRPYLWQQDNICRWTIHGTGSMGMQSLLDTAILPNDVKLPHGIGFVDTWIWSIHLQRELEGANLCQDSHGIRRFRMDCGWSILLRNMVSSFPELFRRQGRQLSCVLSRCSWRWGWLNSWLRLVQCETSGHHLIMSYVFNLSTDLLMLLIPLPILYHSQLAWKKYVSADLFWWGNWHPAGRSYFAVSSVWVYLW